MWMTPPNSFVDKVADKLDDVYRKFAIDCYNNVIALSPVRCDLNTAGHSKPQQGCTAMPSIVRWQAYE